MFRVSAMKASTAATALSRPCRPLHPLSLCRFLGTSNSSSAFSSDRPQPRQTKYSPFTYHPIGGFLPGRGGTTLVLSASRRCFSVTSTTPTAAAAATAATVVDPASLEVAAAASEAVKTSSSTLSEKPELVLNFIPDKPLPLDVLPDGGISLVEPTLHSLGLCSWWPAGRVQYLMENIHVGLDVPWWGTIVIMVVILRLCVFPLVVLSQRNAALLNNNMPAMQALQARMSEARRRGDTYEANVAGADMQKFMMEKKVNPLKNIVPIIVQIPIFMSMFFGLRAMSQLPVESMTFGGCLWFEDLTLSDPFYLLPLFTSCSLLLQFKFAADGANLQQLGPIGKKVMQGMPFLLFPLVMNFPSAVTFYWCTSNVISIIQARLVRAELIREKLKIPKLIKWDKTANPIKQKGFKESVKETFDNWKVQADVADRRSYDEQTFREAGLSRPKRTYRFDPTQPQLKKGP